MVFMGGVILPMMSYYGPPRRRGPRSAILGRVGSPGASRTEMGRLVAETQASRRPFVAPGLDVAFWLGYSVAPATTPGLGTGERVAAGRHVGVGGRRRADYHPGCHHLGGLPLVASQVAPTVPLPRR